MEITGKGYIGIVLFIFLSFGAVVYLDRSRRDGDC
jgi:hypothetical protein